MVKAADAEAVNIIRYQPSPAFTMLAVPLEMLPETDGKPATPVLKLKTQAADDATPPGLPSKLTVNRSLSAALAYKEKVVAPDGAEIVPLSMRCVADAVSSSTSLSAVTLPVGADAALAVTLALVLTQ